MSKFLFDFSLHTGFIKVNLNYWFPPVEILN
jgi:hypothetical protein